MELRDFIRQTLTEIEAGVHEADQAVNATKRYGADSAFIRSANIGPKLEEKSIEFDVAVTTSTSFDGGTKAKANIYVAGLSAGGSAEHTREHAGPDRFTRLRTVQEVRTC